MTTTLLHSLLYLIVACTLQCRCDRSSYTASAVQYNPFGLSPPFPSVNITVDRNIDRFESAIQVSSGDGADIVVFPEAAIGYLQAEMIGSRSRLEAFCEAVTVDSNPCDHADTSSMQLYRLSCLAVKYNITVVFNMCDQVRMSNGTRRIYNTNVVINERGDVIAKYHKSHLFAELFDVAAHSAVVFSSFERSLLLATLICFDIEFVEPTRSLLRLSRHFTFPTWWSSNQPPMLTATMIQQAYSRIHSINLLAANTLRPYTGRGGGLYSSGEPINVRFNSTQTAAEGEFMVLTALMPYMPTQRSRHPFAVLPIILPSRVLEQTNVSCAITSIGLSGQCVFLKAAIKQTVSLVEGAVTCHSTVTADSASSALTNYVLFASDYEYAVDDTTAILMQSCFILRCVSSDKDTNNCDGADYVADATLESVTLTAAFTADIFAGPDATGSVLPMIAVRDAQLLDTEAFIFEERQHDHSTLWQQTTTRPLSESLYSVGMYAVSAHATDLIPTEVT